MDKAEKLLWLSFEQVYKISLRRYTRRHFSGVPWWKRPQIRIIIIDQNLWITIEMNKNQYAKSVKKKGGVALIKINQKTAI